MMIPDLHRVKKRLEAARGRSKLTWSLPAPRAANVFTGEWLKQDVAVYVMG